MRLLGSRTRGAPMIYLHWPLAISKRALEDVEEAVRMYMRTSHSRPDAHAELTNIANEARAMLQKPGLIAKAPEPEDELLG